MCAVRGSVGAVKESRNPRSGFSARWEKGGGGWIGGMTFRLAFFLIASLLVFLLDFAFVFLSPRTFTICEENCVAAHVTHVLVT